MLSPPALSDELILEILELLTDTELLLLATVSKHIHDVALAAYLARHGITETDIQAASFDTTSQALPALCVARFITRIHVLRVHIEHLEISPDLRLSPAETSFLLTQRHLPALRTINVPLYSISMPILSSFLSRHPALQQVHICGRPQERDSITPLPKPLPLDALPRLRSLLGSARLLAWVLASTQPFPCLPMVIIELYSVPGAQDDYLTAMRGLAQRPTTHKLALDLNDWEPWNAPDFAAPTAPERAPARITELWLNFWFPSRPPHVTVLVQWLRLFGGLQEVILTHTAQLEDLSVRLRAEFPLVMITTRILEIRTLETHT
ncbi:hypothetical protein K438DRAFT_2011099 [Mycena galopus ATCC 62051]|nr:hypothetical protein K438DRAFT_2011099 [Mycena galopus ATCC 62051]